MSMSILRGYIIFGLGVVLIFGGLLIIGPSLSNIFPKFLKYVGFISALAGIYLLYWTKENSLTVGDVVSFLEAYGFEVEEEIRRVIGVFFGSWPESRIGKMDGVLVCVDVWWMMRDKDWPSKIKIYLIVPVRNKKLGVVEINGTRVRIPEVYEKYTDKRDLDLFRALAAEFKDIRARFFYNHNFLWMIIDVEAIEGKKALDNIRVSIDAFLKLSRIFNADTEFYKKIEDEKRVVPGDATTKSSYTELELIKSLEKLESKRHIAGIMLFLLWVTLAYISYLIGEGILQYPVIIGCLGLALFFLISGFKFWRLEGKKALRKWTISAKL